MIEQFGENWRHYYTTLTGPEIRTARAPGVATTRKGAPMPVTPLQSAIISIVTVIAGLVVAFGVLDNETASIVTAAATTLVAAVFQIVNEARHSTLVKAGLIK